MPSAAIKELLTVQRKRHTYVYTIIHEATSHGKEKQREKKQE